MTTEKETAKITLQTELLFQDEYIKIETDPSLKYIYVKWFKHPDSETFRRCFKLATDYTIALECKYWLSDARAIHYLEFGDQNWMLEHILPLLPQSKLKKFARISTVESMALLDVARVLSSLDSMPDLRLKTETEVFISKTAALEWLFPEM